MRSYNGREGRNNKMEQSKKSFGSKEIATLGLLLAICVVSQYLKNLSVFITGPIINACLVFAVLLVNLPGAIVLCVITPITAFFIAQSPVTSTVPLVVPFIILGNAVLVLVTHFLMKKRMLKTDFSKDVMNYVWAVVASLAKGVFMGLTISLWLLPTFIPVTSPLRGKMPVFQTTFSLYQFLTALIGYVYVFIIWMIIGNRIDRLSDN